MLESTRLKIIPLNLEQLEMLTRDRNELERAMGLTLSTFILNFDKSFLEEFYEAVIQFVIPAVKQDPVNYEWFTQWLVVDKKENLTIGGLGINGRPDEEGKVMLGYFVDGKYEGRGIATEAVGMLMEFFFRDPSLVAVIADTLPVGKASQRVLEKNGFVFLHEVEEGLRWEKKRNAERKPD